MDATKPSTRAAFKTALVTWQLGSLYTCVLLTWWDWQAGSRWLLWWDFSENLLLGEIWPLYWLVIRPLLDSWS